MGDLIEVASNLGVAVAMSVAFVFMTYQVFKWQREDARNREERDRETITRLSEIVSTNSKALLRNSEVMQEIAKEIGEIGEQIEEMKTDVQEIKLRQKQRDKE